MIFPDVPLAPGVPAVARQVGVLTSRVSLLVADVLSVLGLFPHSPWGIFLDGIRVIDADTVIAVGYQNTWNIADYTIEQGDFRTYDKVNNPFQVRVRVARGGGDVSRAEFIAQCDALLLSLNLFDVVTPERIYTSVNFKHIDYRREATTGLGNIVVDLFGQEIRETAVSTFSQTKSPSAASTVGNGNVQGSGITDHERILIQPNRVQ